MARRRLLSDEQMAPFWAWATDEREIVRHYTLSPADIELVAKRRAGPNRLGFAVLMCGYAVSWPRARCARDTAGSPFLHSLPVRLAYR